MARRDSASEPTWTDVKRKLAALDSKVLLKLLQDLYAANPDNRAFLNTRFGLGGDALAPYKKTISRWVWPNVLARQDASPAKARQAITIYRKASGDPAGVAELMTFYCEQAAGYCRDVGNQDEGFFTALVHMFEWALLAIQRLPRRERDALIARLDRVRQAADGLGYGVGPDMNRSFRKHAGADSD